MIFLITTKPAHRTNTAVSDCGQAGNIVLQANRAPICGPTAPLGCCELPPVACPTNASNKQCTPIDHRCAQIADVYLRYVPRFLRNIFVEHFFCFYFACVLGGFDLVATERLDEPVGPPYWTSSLKRKRQYRKYCVISLCLKCAWAVVTAHRKGVAASHTIAKHRCRCKSFLTHDNSDA